jgi:flagellar protein FliJ
MTAFRLAGLLRLRQSQEEQAAAELARANAAREAAQRRRQDTEQMLAGSTLPSRSDELMWKVAIAGRAALGGLVAESVVALGAASLTAEDAARTWTDARARATTLGKLEERHDAQVRAAEEHAEQVAVDETATRRAAARAADDPAPTPEGGR